MRIAVVGAGAMGSIFGAALARGGDEVTLVDVAEPLVEKVNADGVTIVRGDDRTTTRVPATSDPSSVGVADAVVFFVKCYHTASAAELAQPLVGPETVVASLQNGWGNGDVLAAAFPPEQVVVGVTYNSGLIVEPGVVMHPADQPTFVGHVRRRRYRARGAARRGPRACRARHHRHVAGATGDLEEADPERRDAAAGSARRDERRRARSP